MSDSQNAALEVKNHNAIDVVAKKLGHRIEHNVVTTLYDGRKVKGSAIYIQGWDYPIAISETGEVVYDNHLGRWGDQRKLDELLQQYAKHVLFETAALQGCVLNSERELENGDFEYEFVTAGSDASGEPEAAVW